MKASMTFNIHEAELQSFESYMRNQLDVIDFRILPETRKLYEEDKHFKKLIDEKRKLGLEIDRYINEHNI